MRNLRSGSCAKRPLSQERVIMTRRKVRAKDPRLIHRSTWARSERVT
jgi:hypothetical protein